MAKFGVRASARLGLGVGASLLALSGTAEAQTACAGMVVDGVCTVTNSGTRGAVTIAIPTSLTNSGTISGDTGVTVTTGGRTMIDNRATGVISGAVDAIRSTPGFVLDSDLTVINAGTINGDVRLPDRFPQSTFVSAGGTLNGNLIMGGTGFGSQVFIQRGATTGVTGTVSAGNGIDIFVRSHAQSTTVTLGAPLAATFEFEGVEALGRETIVTLNSAPGSTASGIALYGDGQFVNNAHVGPFSADGAGFPGGIEFNFDAIGYGGEPGVSRSLPIDTFNGSVSILYGSALSGFTNNGTIDGDIRISTASFVNTGAINLRTSSNGTRIFSAANSDFTFDNRGTIGLTEDGPRPEFVRYEEQVGLGRSDATIRLRSAPDSSVLATADVFNSGTIEGLLDVGLVGETVNFRNSGTIDGVSLDVGSLPRPADNARFENVAANVTVTNSGSGRIMGSFDAFILADVTRFDNLGQISDALRLEAGMYGSYGQTAPPRTAQGVTMTNGGSIDNGVQIFGDANANAFTNTGTVSRREFVPFALTALDFEGRGIGDAQLTLVNAPDATGVGGVIRNQGRGSAAVLFLQVASGRAAREPIGMLTVVNGGSILADGGAVYIPSGSLDFASLAAGLAVGVNSVGSSHISIENRSGALISANGPLGIRQFDGTVLGTGPVGAFSVAVAAAADAVDIVNAGTIRGGGGTAFTLDRLLINGAFNLAQGTVYLAGAIQTLGSVDHVTNTATGIITGSIDLGAFGDRLENYGAIDGDVFLRAGNDSFVHGIGAVFDGTADGGDGTDALVIDITGGGTLDAALYGRFTGFESIGLIGNGAITADGTVPFQTVELAGATLELRAGSTLRTLGATAITGSDTSGDHVVNAGTIVGDVDLGGGDDSFDNRGTVTGAIDLGDGADRFAAAGGSSVGGGVSGGAGVDSIDLVLTAGASGRTVLDLSLFERLTDFEQLAVSGGGALLAAGDLPVETLILEGTMLEVAAGTSLGTTGPVTVTGTDAIESIVNRGTIAGGIALGGGGDSLTNAGTVIGDVDLGGGDDSFDNRGSITGDLDLGDGADRFAPAGGSSIGGSVSGGAGVDSIDLVLTAGASGQTVLDLPLFERLTDFEQLAVSGSGSLLAAGDLHVETLILDGTMLEVAAGTSLGTIGPVTVTGTDAIESIVNRGTITGGIALGGGGDSLTNGGSIVGPVDLGAGDDLVTLQSRAAFGTGVSGGAGSDTLALATSGTAAVPVELDLGRFTQFEILRNTGGTVALSGAGGFGQIDVAGGRLIGRAGSTITGNVAVGSGATFGSAGAVIGNISVASGGTLSPGASPGTMMVTGNVSLAGGSTTVLEFTPSVTDRLAISGTLKIANGTTLNLVGERPLTPGVTLDLIVAGGGINGSFGTTNKASTILGFLLQTSTKLQLLGQFVTPAGTAGQTAATIDYVNDVLVAGQGSVALLAAIPSLLDTDGSAKTPAFAQLNPEAYATASQLGIEQGQSLAKASRSGMATTTREESGPFTFAEGIGDWRTLKGDATSGVSRAKSHSHGMIGGIGIGSREAAFGAFIGYVDSSQSIAALGARTEADGIVAGIAGHAEQGGFDLTALMAYDASEAHTRRAVPGSTVNSGDYALRSLIFDASAGYSLAVSSDWALRPEIGITHVSTRRSGVSESGSAAFALAVDRARSRATFIDGALTLRGGQADKATIHPWLSAGIRHQLDGETSRASAGFVGVSSRFTVAGAARKETMVTAGAGADVALSEGLSLFGVYRGEFGGGNGHNVNVGVRFAF